jgi:hypothetical protein
MLVLFLRSLTKKPPFRHRALNLQLELPSVFRSVWVWSVMDVPGRSVEFPGEGKLLRGSPEGVDPVKADSKLERGKKDMLPARPLACSGKDADSLCQELLGAVDPIAADGLFSGSFFG